MSNRITLDELKAYLWNSAVLLRTSIDAGAYKQYIFPLLFFKRICDVYDEETQKAVEEYGDDIVDFDEEDIHTFVVPEGYHWKDVRQVSENVGAAIVNALLELAHDAVKAEKEVVPVAEIDRGKAALTELFNGVKNSNTPIIVERIVKDIDDIVRIVRFDGWQDTVAGRKEVKKALRSVVSVKYKIKDREVFDKAYQYVEQYY